MKCAIMQPTYLPWSGYFNLIQNVDYFVFLNDVQFNKRSWQQRNRISLNGQEKYMTIPVHSKGKPNQLINQVEIVLEENILENHFKTLKFAYENHPYGNEVITLYEKNINLNMNLLQDINVMLIKDICEILDIKTKILFSSDIPVSGQKSMYLHNICNYLEVTEYLSPIGSKQYIEEEQILPQSNISIQYQNFEPKQYAQYLCKEFIPYLSILDVIANIGIDKTKEYIK
ncbi:WbqC family protein [Lysinibacillus sp. NPDC093712]|uniref:WbqC family protein n=1 Tax=Lysinibacillus sp. NPDC093712 TaxID=3390579 RepID=UPI003CFFEE41